MDTGERTYKASFVFVTKMHLSHTILSRHARNMNLHFDISINFYQFRTLVRQDNTNTKHFVSNNIVKNNSFILHSPSENSQSQKFKFQ